MRKYVGFILALRELHSLMRKPGVRLRRNTRKLDFDTQLLREGIDTVAPRTLQVMVFGPKRGSGFGTQFERHPFEVNVLVFGRLVQRNLRQEAIRSNEIGKDADP